MGFFKKNEDAAAPARKSFVLSDADVAAMEAPSTTEGYISGQTAQKADNLRSSLINNFGDRSDEVTGTNTAAITTGAAATNPRSSFVNNFGNRSDNIATRASVADNNTKMEFRRSQLRDSTTN